jgi:hypothetical protein
LDYFQLGKFRLKNKAELSLGPATVEMNGITLSGLLVVMGRQTAAIEKT